MRINNQALEAFSQGSVHRASQPQRTESSGTSKPPAATSTEAATVAISDEARQLALASRPPEAIDKVAALKEAVDNGTFQVNSQMVAQRIIDRLA